MAVAESNHEVQTTARLLTCADVAVLPEQLPSGAVDYELDNGRLIVMSPPARTHSRFQARIVTELTLQGEERGCGEAHAEVGVVLWRSPDRLVGPDAAFIAQKSLPARCTPEGYLETIPELVVEIRSKNDTAADLVQKAEDYLKAGVELVWIVDPQQRTVAIHRRVGEVQTPGEPETLTAEPVIPGFSLPLARLFE